MPYLETAQQWLTQSQLLLQARPTTTRITSKYNIAPPSTSPEQSKKSKARPETTPTPSTTDLAAPRATLTLKTYDPASGTTLKYNTNKAAEVSRLIQILGRLARPMAGLPEVKEEDVGMARTGEAEEEAVVAPPAVGGKNAGAQGGQGQAQGGKGKGKKKGKK